MPVRFVANVLLNGRIRCATGLHIGATERGGDVGAADHPVVRDPAGDYPFIPGSSIKGRIRNLLAWAHADGSDGAGLAARVFGTSAGRGHAAPHGPTRLHVRDSFPTAATRDLMDRLVREKGLPHVEVKAETALNRFTGEAGPRWIERVPAGSEFEFSLLYGIYDVDGDKASDIRGIGEVIRGLRMLEDSGLGAGASRGNGQVSISLAAVPVVRDPRSYLELAETAPAGEPTPVGKLDAAGYLNTVAAALNVSL